MKKLLFLCLIILSLSSFADQHSLRVKVKGMVCAFCTSGVKKVIGQQSQVSNVEVNMDKQLVTIKFKKGKTLSHKKVTELIEGAGFNVDSIKEEK